MDTRKWVLSKALPKIFGDKLVNEHTGRDGGPIIQTAETRDVIKDHLEGLSRRFAEGLKMIEGGAPAKLNGRNGSASSAEEALNEASAKWLRENGRRDH